MEKTEDRQKRYRTILVGIYRFRYGRYAIQSLRKALLGSRHLVNFCFFFRIVFSLVCTMPSISSVFSQSTTSSRMTMYVLIDFGALSLSLLSNGISNVHKNHTTHTYIPFTQNDKFL